MRNFSTRKGIAIPLLSDPDSATIRTFGILNENIPKTSPFFGVPHPVTYIVGRDRVVQSVYHEEDYRKRFTTGAILSDSLNTTEALAGENPRLNVRTSSSDTVVRGGERVRLFVTVALAPKVHVYAPGVSGYIPVDLKIVSPPGSDVAPTSFPGSRMMRLEAIKETVPVFEGTFQLTRDLTVGQPKELEGLLDEHRMLTITGTLRYQACDEVRCWVPDEIPLKWTFRYESHDSTRVPADLRRR